MVCDQIARESSRKDHKTSQLSDQMPKNLQKREDYAARFFHSCQKGMRQSDSALQHAVDPQHSSVSELYRSGDSGGRLAFLIGERGRQTVAKSEIASRDD